MFFDPFITFPLTAPPHKLCRNHENAFLVDQECVSSIDEKHSLLLHVYLLRRFSVPVLRRDSHLCATLCFWNRKREATRLIRFLSIRPLIDRYSYRSILLRRPADLSHSGLHRIDL